MSSANLEADQDSRGTKKFVLESIPISAEGTGSPEQDIRESKSSVPKAATADMKRSKHEANAARKVLSRSFRALSSVLGLSMITKLSKSKSQKSTADDAKEVKNDFEWADIVDTVVESDSESESMDTYIEFTRRRGLFLRNGILFRSSRNCKTNTTRSDEPVAPEKNSVPWFTAKTQ